MVSLDPTRTSLPPSEDQEDRPSSQPSTPTWGIDGDPTARPIRGIGPVAPTPSSSDNVPLDPAILRFALGPVSRTIAEITEYPPWEFTDAELDAMVDALANLGVQLPAWTNAVMVMVTIFAGKAMGYVVWRRAGKPPLNASTRRIMDLPPEPAGYDVDGE